jgi:23S rRNA (cytosine1962-C5)-methyltransferase
MRAGNPPRWISGELLCQFAAEHTTAHRICSAPDRWVERFGNDYLVSYKTDAEDLIEALPAWLETHDLALDRIFRKHLPRQNAERIAPVLHSGDPTIDLATWVEERDVQFGIDFGAGYSAGLFVDQRANRAWARERRPGSVLNCFAYTCAFSVVTALEGARTVSIDLSRKSLDRGRANFERNGLDPAPHRFIADDVLDVLPRLSRRGERFDMIILDPPTFSRGNKGRRFDVEEDLETLILSALDVAGPGAHILVSTNCTRIDRHGLERMTRFALRTQRRAADFFHTEPPPDIPAFAAPSTLWLTLRG